MGRLACTRARVSRVSFFSWGALGRILGAARSDDGRAIPYLTTVIELFATSQ